ncbi:unnamed protein product [Ixodes pacificus]
MNYGYIPYTPRPRSIYLATLKRARGLVVQLLPSPWPLARISSLPPRLPPRLLQTVPSIPFDAAEGTARFAKGSLGTVNEQTSPQQTHVSFYFLFYSTVRLQ